MRMEKITPTRARKETRNHEGGGCAAASKHRYYRGKNFSNLPRRRCASASCSPPRARRRRSSSRSVCFPRENPVLGAARPNRRTTPARTTDSSELGLHGARGTPCIECRKQQQLGSPCVIFWPPLGCIYNQKYGQNTLGGRQTGFSLAGRAAELPQRNARKCDAMQLPRRREEQKKVSFFLMRAADIRPYRAGWLFRCAKNERRRGAQRRKNSVTAFSLALGAGTGREVAS